MTQSLDRHHDLSERNLQCIDARLEAMQKMLPRSISTNQRSNPKSRKTLASRAKDTKSRCSNPTFQRAEALKSSETQTSVLRPATQPLRVVCPALLIYEKDGLLRRELVPLVCSELNGIEDATKIQVIKYLQGLRLLIWLLKKNNPWTTNVSELGITSRSLFAMQAEWSLSQGFANDYLGSHETFMRAIKFQMLEAVVLLFEVMSPYRQVPPSVIRAAACRKQFKIQEVRILFQETSPQGPVGRWFLELLRTELLYNPTSSVLLGLVDAILRATREPVVGSKCLSRSFI